ncbi:hypothetical protein [Amycolatopsis sp. NPDC051128]|uniref:hypothetical protein n=1 Tax=Amycolatopsis sp. NPDC051128 TaxID=3155412 RepID=UPI003431BA01
MKTEAGPICDTSAPIGWIKDEQAGLGPFLEDLVDQYSSGSRAPANWSAAAFNE